MTTQEITTPFDATTGLELLPCPFCGGPSTLTVKAAMWSAGCPACGIETIGLMSETDALEAWNQRNEWQHARIGAELRRARKKNGISVRQLAQRLKCSAVYVSDLERGRRIWTAEKLRWYRNALTPNRSIHRTYTEDNTKQHSVKNIDVNSLK